MNEYIQALLIAIGFIVMVGASGVAFTAAVAAVCQWFEWSPINITVNIYRLEDQDN